MMPTLRNYPGVGIETFILLAAAVIAEGLVDLEILQGNAEDLVEMDAHAVSRVGHLLGWMSTIWRIWVI